MVRINPAANTKKRTLGILDLGLSANLTLGIWFLNDLPTILGDLFQSCLDVVDIVEVDDTVWVSGVDWTVDLEEYTSNAGTIVLHMKGLDQMLLALFDRALEDGEEGEAKSFGVEIFGTSKGLYGNLEDAQWWDLRAVSRATEEGFTSYHWSVWFSHVCKGVNGLSV